MKSLVLIQSNTIFKTFKYFTKGQLNFLKEKGLSVHTICSPDTEAAYFFSEEGVTYKPIQIERDISTFKDISATFKIISYIFKTKPTIVQGSTPKAGFLTLIGAWICKVPVRVFFMRGVRSSGLTGIKHKIVEFMEKTTCRCAHQVLCTSNSVLNEIVEKGICSPNKAKVLHYGTGNGIDTDNRFNPARFADSDKNNLKKEYGINKNNKILLFVGRLVKDKGLIELYHAWQLLKEDFSDLTLLLIGYEEKIDPLPKEIALGLKNDNNVRVLTSIQDCAPFYAISDIFILPSYREGIPVSALEASSMELPVITTRATGCIDAIIDNVTGKLVDAKDYNDLKEKITSYLIDSESAVQHGKNGRTFIKERYKPEDIWNALYNEYLRLYNAIK